MSDREFPGFDVEAVQEAVRQPPLDDLYRVSAQRRRRRSSGVVLFLVVVLGAATLAPFVDGADQVAGPGDRSVVPVVTELFVVGETSAVGVEVADDGCSISFGHTEDLGATWSEFRPLRHEVLCREDATGYGRFDTRYQPLNLRTYLASVDGRSYLSMDAGRTWQDAESAITAVDAFPAGADPVACQAGCFGLSYPLAVDEEAGMVFRLRGESPSRYPLHEMYESPDGALWAAYWPGDLEKPSVVARSVDRGATWQPSTLPEQFTGGTPPALIGLAAESGQVAHLLTQPRNGDGPTALIFRTSDGGRTWTETVTDLPGSAIIRPFTVGVGQTLIVADFDETDGYVWASNDGGRHFTKGPTVEPGSLGGGPGRVWIVDQDGASITSDGTTWERLSVPQ